MTKTSIEWTQESWNPIVGCSIKSPGCTNCYAMARAHRIEASNIAAYAALEATGMRRGTAPQYDGTTKLVNGHPVWTGKLAMAGDHILLAPLKRKKPTMYFVNSMGDLFHEDCDIRWIVRAFAVMALTQRHTYQILTKRAERMQEIVSWLGKSIEPLETAAREMGYTLKFEGQGMISWPPPNVWLGVSAERQQEADERIPILYQTPAAIRFASFEPLLGRIKIPSRMKLQDDGIVVPVGLDWAIAGAESGPGARDCEEEWVRYLKNQCVPAGVAFFYKQHAKNGKKIPTPELDGQRWVEMPRLREAATRGKS